MEHSQNNAAYVKNSAKNLNFNIFLLLSHSDDVTKKFRLSFKQIYTCHFTIEGNFC